MRFVVRSRKANYRMRPRLCGWSVESVAACPTKEKIAAVVSMIRGRTRVGSLEIPFDSMDLRIGGWICV